MIIIVQNNTFRKKLVKKKLLPGTVAYIRYTFELNYSTFLYR